MSRQAWTGGRPQRQRQKKCIQVLGIAMFENQKDCDGDNRATVRNADN